MTLAENPSAVSTAPPPGGISAEAVRDVARIYLAQGFGPGQVRREARRTMPEHEPMFAMVADAMDALLAGGFDAEAFRKELHAADEAAVALGYPGSAA